MKSIKEHAEGDLAEFKVTQKQRYEDNLNKKTQELSTLNDGGDAKKSEKAFEAIQSDYKANKDSVIEMLIKNLMNVNVEIPKVVKGNFEDD